MGSELPQNSEQREVKFALPVRISSSPSESAYCNIVDANNSPIALSVAKVHAPLIVEALNNYTPQNHTANEPQAIEI